MARPKGTTPPREYVNARIRKDLSDTVDTMTANGNPTRSQMIERALDLYVRLPPGMAEVLLSIADASGKERAKLVAELNRDFLPKL
jgi:hypothetical protein